MTKLRRFSAFLYPFPRVYVDPEATTDLDFEEWSNDFTWRQDDWNGLKDFAQPVRETISSERGDCEDYALVAASSLIERGYNNVQIGFCFNTWHGLPYPRHVVAYHANTVYSSGSIYNKTKSEYIDWSEYDYAIWRTV